MSRTIDESTRNTDLPARKFLSWSAIIAGALVALSLSFLIHTLNLGLGLSGLTTSEGGMIALAVGGMLWLLIISVITMFIAGWVAGFLARNLTDRPFMGIVHGFLAWSLALVIGIGLVSGFAGSLLDTNNAVPTNKVELVAKQAGYDTGKAITPSKSTERAAGVAGAVSLATFFVFLFGAISAGVGGYFGTSERGRRWVNG